MTQEPEVPRCPKCQVSMREPRKCLYVCPKCRGWFAFISEEFEFHDFPIRVPGATT